MQSRKNHNTDPLKHIASICSVLSCPVRLEVLIEILLGVGYICDIASKLELAAPLVSHHIRMLVAAGFVDSPHAGGRSHYVLSERLDVVLSPHHLEIVIGCDGDLVHIKTKPMGRLAHMLPIITEISA